MHFEIYQEQANQLARLASTAENSLLAPPSGQWRWRLRGDNGRILASGESFHNRADCESSIHLVMSTSMLGTPIKLVDK